jgi:hypothetical protein
MATKCRSRKKDGARCSADAQSGKDVCVFHDPERVEDGRRARRAGGINSGRAVAVLSPDTPEHPLAKPADVSTLLAASVNQLRRGELDPRIATAIGYLASVQLRSFDQGRLEERLAKIEEALGLLPMPQLGGSEPEESEPR